MRPAGSHIAILYVRLENVDIGDLEREAVALPVCLQLVVGLLCQPGSFRECLEELVFLAGVDQGFRSVYSFFRRVLRRIEVG